MKGYLRIAIRAVMALLVALLVFLGLAGRTTYWQGWVFSSACVFAVTAESLIYLKTPELLKERRKPGPGTKWWDKLFWILYMPTYLSILLIAGLDGGRYQWSPALPVVVYVGAYMTHLFGYAMYLWAMRTNRFFSTTVRIQSERGHQLVQDGPYRYVRHPGYVGGIFLGASTALVLGSLWALVPAGIMILLLVIRTFLEDSTLQKELPGYDEYVKRVKARLIPGFW